MTHCEINPTRSRAIHALSHLGRLASFAALAVVVMTLGVGCSGDSVSGPTPVPTPTPTPAAPLEVQPLLDPNLQAVFVDPPDLVISIINFSPGAPTAGDEITFWIFVKNVGDGAAPASKLNVRVGGETYGQTVDVPALAAGAQYKHTRLVTLNVAQNYRVTATADALDDVSESDEGNNVGMRDFTVAP
jgi:hypothetical protein